MEKFSVQAKKDQWFFSFTDWCPKCRLNIRIRWKMATPKIWWRGCYHPFLTTFLVRLFRTNVHVKGGRNESDQVLLLHKKKRRKDSVVQQSAVREGHKAIKFKNSFITYNCARKGDQNSILEVSIQKENRLRICYQHIFYFSVQATVVSKYKQYQRRTKITILW